MVEIGTNVKSVNKGKIELSFEHDLWDQLPKITAYARESSRNLNAFRDFNQNIAKLTFDFAAGLKQTCQNMQLVDTATAQSKKPQLPKSLLSSIRNLKSGCEVLAAELEDMSFKIVHEIVEPLEQYNKKYCCDV